MDTTTNELQALRKEIDALRKENIELYRELTRQNETVSNAMLTFRAQCLSNFKEIYQQQLKMNKIFLYLNDNCIHDNLNKYLNRLAGMQTAQFIVDNMPKIKAFNNRNDYLKYALSQAAGDGLYLEFGVYKGESINFIASTLPDKIIYGFDSFEGLPEDWRYDLQKGGFDVKGVLPQVNENVRLVKGWFNEALPEFVKAHSEQCAFIHIDCDLYSSTKTVLDTLKNQIGAGTVIAFDEYYNYPGWQEGEYKAFNEFIASNHLEFEYVARANMAQVSVKIK